MLLTDGPFVDGQDYLRGFIVVETGNLDRPCAEASA
jgi:hypothetical protein